MTKLNRELLKRWVAALRSGDYKQGRGHLHSRWDDTYCCLGVLREIEPSISQNKHDPNTLDENSLQEHMGCRFPQGELINMNDGLGKTFPEIADFIENNYINNEEDNT